MEELQVTAHGWCGNVQYSNKFWIFLITSLGGGNGCNDDEIHGETELENSYSSDIDCLILESAVMAKEFGAGESGHGHLLVLLRMEVGEVFILFMTCMVECRSSQMTNQ
jgi:hypothetical protein